MYAPRLLRSGCHAQGGEGACPAAAAGRAACPAAAQCAGYAVGRPKLNQVAVRQHLDVAAVHAAAPCCYLVRGQST